MPGWRTYAPPVPTSPRERVADACPGVLRTHAAADGALARLRLPGGLLDATAARALAACAREFGDGYLELTSRGNVQLRGLADGAATILAARARAAGLLPSDTHERVRNIVASPLSGRAVASWRDVTPLVEALDRALCADPALAALPGRILFALDDGSGDVAALPADLTLIALPAGRMLLRVAGEPRAVLLPERCAIPAILAAAHAFLDLLAATAPGDTPAWRIAELPTGHDRLLTAAQLAARRARTDDREPPAATIKIIQAGTAARSRGDASAVTPGPHRHSDGRYALTVLVPLGRLRADQLDLLAEIADEAAGDSRMVVTPWRTVVLRDLDPSASQGFGARLAAVGLVVDPASGWVGVTSCAGRPGCARALADVRRDAARYAAHVQGSTTSVHWSACARRCGRPAGDVVDVIADESGYRVHGGEELPADRWAALSRELASRHESASLQELMSTCAGTSGASTGREGD